PPLRSPTSSPAARSSPDTPKDYDPPARPTRPCRLPAGPRRLPRLPPPPDPPKDSAPPARPPRPCRLPAGPRGLRRLTHRHKPHDVDRDTSHVDHGQSGRPRGHGGGAVRRRVRPVA